MTIAKINLNQQHSQKKMRIICECFFFFRSEAVKQLNIESTRTCESKDITTFFAFLMHFLCINKMNNEKMSSVSFSDKIKKKFNEIEMSEMKPACV